ncbi:hypothetical protein T01_1864 [Trichinella spiralis]|uniref:Uncharacterized protein n=1 Tax=Trichinella spiralis TaxID=6334 RepID=A0A0V1BY76_TRISP|nr:hypothetical protein T01_1864 [Trichinella spiralis]
MTNEMTISDRLLKNFTYVAIVHVIRTGENCQANTIVQHISVVNSNRNNFMVRDLHHISPCSIFLSMVIHILVHSLHIAVSLNAARCDL